MQKPGRELVPIWEAGVTGGSLLLYATALAPGKNSNLIFVVYTDFAVSTWLG